MITLRSYLEKKYSKSTLNSNLYNIRRFTDYCGNRSEKANYKDVLQYIEHLRKNHDLHPKTLRHCLYAVKIYFNYLLEIGKRKDHPCSELFLKDKVSKQIQVDNLYSEETLENYFETYHIRKKSYLQNRNKIMISLLIYQALTVNEVSALQTGDINLDRGEIYIKGREELTAKSPQSRTLPLQAKQILLFYHYLKKDRAKLLKYNQRNPNEESFILGQYGEKINPHGISKMINETRKGNEQIKPMKIRQSVIANLLKKENDTRIVQVFAGHKRASTTQQYKQTDLEILQNAVNLYHPLK
ncbi:tyrosine-type recombinase/integrase [Elizabethkingia argentiflava]|uniref:Tyrosine-type recombinase/integrase n=1 Tax=Elizabethkingia argenteiflava TaxID=2681556 RepID=A0A845PSS4_9FLAO|nr:tyrosine-type recombinase/integrase [Elizabethkingia argenteiflava]NAW50091.1 tyrosine-type recombinase/integrase [Elizabethkingia argenteiflava]